MVLLDKSLPGGHGHPLFGLVRECLSNIPERRPTTANLLSSLEATGREMEGGMLLQDIAQVKNTRAFKAKDKRIEALQVSRTIGLVKYTCKGLETEIVHVTISHYFCTEA